MTDHNPVSTDRPMTPQERIHWPPFTHGRIVCGNCKTVVAQCRCIKGCEVVGTVQKCDKCPPSTEETRKP